MVIDWYEVALNELVIIWFKDAGCVMALTDPSSLFLRVHNRRVNSKPSRVNAFRLFRLRFTCLHRHIECLWGSLSIILKIEIKKPKSKMKKNLLVSFSFQFKQLFNPLILIFICSFIAMGSTHSKPTEGAPPTLSTTTTTNTTTVPAIVTPNQGPALPKSASPVDPSAFFKYGFPGPVHDLHYHDEFVSSYDRRMRNPGWVVEHITAQSLLQPSNGPGTPPVDRKKSVFMEDQTIPAMFRGKLSDYFRSGYDRGHQAPAADAKFSQSAMNETFFLSNMAPQVGEGFNRDYWAHFEDFCRRLTQQYTNVRIVTGPLYLPKRDPVDGKFRVTYEVIGNPPSVAVPTHFFKLIVAEQPVKDQRSTQVAVGAFVLPNDRIANSTPLKSFAVPVDALERSSGFQFLANLPVTQRKELCQEVTCDIIVREFTQKALPRK